MHGMMVWILIRRFFLSFFLFPSTQRSFGSWAVSRSVTWEAWLESSSSSGAECSRIVLRSFQPSRDCQFYFFLQTDIRISFSLFSLHFDGAISFLCCSLCVSSSSSLLFLFLFLFSHSTPKQNNRVKEMEQRLNNALIEDGQAIRIASRITQEESFVLVRLTFFFFGDYCDMTRMKITIPFIHSLISVVSSWCVLSCLSMAAVEFLHSGGRAVDLGPCS